MRAAVGGGSPPSRVRPGGAAAALALVAAATAVLLIGSPGRAAAAAGGTCVTDAYQSTVTVLPCPSTTTTTIPAGSATVSLRISYGAGRIEWTACGFTAAAEGTSVYLYLDGRLQTQPGGRATVEPGGCSRDPADPSALASFPFCPSADATLTAVAVDPAAAVSTPAVSVSVQPSACLAAAGASTADALGAGNTGHGPAAGALAFTGGNVVLLTAMGILAVLTGWLLVRRLRPARHRS